MCIVGPAASLIDSKAGNSINKMDLVIRTNDCFKILPEYWDDYGSRCDVLYLNNAWIRRNFIKNKNKDSVRDVIRHIVHVNKTRLIVTKGMGAKKIIERMIKLITPREAEDIGVVVTGHNWRSQKHFWKKGLADARPYYEPLLLTYVLSDIILANPKTITITGCDFYANSNCWVDFYNKNLNSTKEGILRKKTHSVMADREYLLYLQSMYSIKLDEVLTKIINP